MASSDTFASGTPFTAQVTLDSDTGTAYGQVEFAMVVSEYPERHTLDTSDIADAVRDLFENAGYTITEFTAPVTTHTTLDWPGDA